ncbi:MAG: hypothetical protein AB7G87_01145 [Clostridia bacterium]
MIISGNNLRLCYWKRTKSGSGYVNLPEIETGVYGYDLQSGQKIFRLAYDNTNLERYFDCLIHDVNEQGVLISHFLSKDEKRTFVPWAKEFPCPAPNGPVVKCELYIEPCEYLYELNLMRDILSYKIPYDSLCDGKLDKDKGHGIWYKHGGWRTLSKYEENLDRFFRFGQMEII